MNELRRRWRVDGARAVVEALAAVAALARRDILSRIYRRRFAHLGRRSWIERARLLTNPRFIWIGNNVYVRENARIEAIRHYAGETFQPRLTIDDGTFIEYDAHIACAHRVEIGKNVLIAGGVFISDHHHAAAGEDRHPLHMPLRTAAVRIGDGCWLGERAAILPGVTLGARCVVGAGAVVTKSFPSGSTVIGVPARAIAANHPSERAEHRDREEHQ